MLFILYPMSTRAPGTGKEVQKGFLAKGWFASLTDFWKAISVTHHRVLADPQVLGFMEQMELQNHTAWQILVPPLLTV